MKQIKIEKIQGPRMSAVREGPRKILIAALRILVPLEKIEIWSDFHGQLTCFQLRIMYLSLETYLGWNENETNLLSNMKLKCCIIIVNFYYSQKSPKGSQTQVHDWIFIQSASFFDILFAFTTKHSLVNVTFLDMLNYFLWELNSLELGMCWL